MVEIILILNYLYTNHYKYVEILFKVQKNTEIVNSKMLETKNGRSLLLSMLLLLLNVFLIKILLSMLLSMSYIIIKNQDLWKNKKQNNYIVV